MDSTEGFVVRVLLVLAPPTPVTFLLVYSFRPSVPPSTSWTNTSVS